MSCLETVLKKSLVLPRPGENTPLGKQNLKNRVVGGGWYGPNGSILWGLKRAISLYYSQEIERVTFLGERIYSLENYLSP